MFRDAFIFGCALALLACAKPQPGPDKQFAGGLQGAVTGAGAGAVTGFQVGSGTGPGAVVGAGLGFVAGGIQGAVDDRSEDDLLKLAAATRMERERAMVHEVLEDQYRRRVELHPTREIYPADLFFVGDEGKLRPGAQALIKELAGLNKRRLAWSRLAVIAYAKSADQENEFAQHLVQLRSREIVDELVRQGLEPRRLEARGILIKAELLRDPNDNPGRYNQAIEIVPLDR